MFQCGFPWQDVCMSASDLQQGHGIPSKSSRKTVLQSRRLARSNKMSRLGGCSWMQSVCEPRNLLVNCRQKRQNNVKLIWRRLCGAMIEGTEHPFHWRIGE
eukprot:symbB.v1.2.018243.t1/scaffold1447.1/size118252/3